MASVIGVAPDELIKGVFELRIIRAKHQQVIDLVAGLFSHAKATNHLKDLSIDAFAQVSAKDVAVDAGLGGSLLFYQFGNVCTSQQAILCPGMSKQHIAGEQEQLANREMEAVAIAQLKEV